VQSVELRLPRGAGTRDHGYAAELDADLDGVNEVVLDAGGLGSLHPLFAVRFALWLERQQQGGRSVEVKEPKDAETCRCFRAFRLGKGIGGVAEALVEDDPDVIIRPPD
jgi:hypothetical protein